MALENFQWLPEYDDLLDKIATSEIVDLEWGVLRDAIKYKITENIGVFLAEKPPPSPPAFQPQNLPSGGLKLPPFPPRKQARGLTNMVPLSYMTEEQANELKGHIFAQIDEFDSGPPFTIQRVCELCLHPCQHYSSVGKYLRAVEKSLLVTSTFNSFPPLSELDKDPNGRSVFSLGSTRQSEPSTPLFSPIPFLHEDARRSKSRSPPPSPLALGSAASVVSDQSDQLETKALGLVDELDDPGPGHLSDHPVALTSVITMPSMSDHTSSRPIFGSLEQRFVKGSANESDPDTMAIDEDKENNQV